jgi:hypothetical protein
VDLEIHAVLDSVPMDARPIYRVASKTTSKIAGNLFTIFGRISTISGVVRLSVRTSHYSSGVPGSIPLPCINFVVFFKIYGGCFVGYSHWWLIII